jgi:hypothetical protein
LGEVGAEGGGLQVQEEVDLKRIEALSEMHAGS